MTRRSVAGDPGFAPPAPAVNPGARGRRSAGLGVEAVEPGGVAAGELEGVLGAGILEGTGDDLDVFAPFGGFADDCPVEDGFVRLSAIPGVGFEAKSEPYRVMRPACRRLHLMRPLSPERR